MFSRQSLHIAMLVWGGIFCLIAALCMCMSRNFDRDKRKWMLLMQMTAAILLFSDALAWGFRGDGDSLGYAMVRISNFLVFFMSDVLIAVFHGYTCCYLFRSDNTEWNVSKTAVRRSRKTAKLPVHRIRLVNLVAVIGMLLVILSQFYHFYYYFDRHNFYHRNSGNLISFLIPLIGMILDLSLIIQYRKRISHQIFVSLVSYIILPMAALIVQTFYYGISMINISISISMILMFVVAMVEQNQNLAYKQKEAANLKISLMLSQIAPHLIYNSLTTIQGLCERDPKLAKETVGEFAGYLRGNLESLSEEGTISFERELKHVQCYLAIEKKRFGDRVNVEYHIEEEDFMIPALTLQPIVENAVKHGICKKEDGGTVYISTERKGDRIYVTVRDDGVGFDKDRLKQSGSHIGLSNVQSRLRSMCHGNLLIESREGAGTVVVISLPQE